jgi:hypothetical protein
VSAAGTSSDKQPLPFEPYVSRDGLRLTTVYATSWTATPSLSLHRPVGEWLRLGRLARFYEVSQHQLPRVVVRQEIDAASLCFERWSDTAAVRGVRVWLFALPSNQLLTALSLDVGVSLVDSVPLLEDLYYDAIAINGAPLEQWLGAHLMPGVAIDRPAGLLPERHQLVYCAVPAAANLPTADQVQRVIYRADLPCRPDQSSISYPVELNRRPTTMAALGPYVSVIAGHQDYLENTVLLSAVHVTGSTARLREIRERAYNCVARFRASTEHTDSPRDQRLVLEEIADTLGDLELELSFSVEATADLGMLVPSLRVENYHEALCESTRMARRAETTGHMLGRLRNAIAAELTAVQSIENRADDARRVRTVAAVTFVSTVAGTLSLLFGFFGINATQVNANHSMFDPRYVWIYLLILFLLGGAAAIFLGMRYQERRQHQRDQRRTWVPPQRDARQRQGTATTKATQAHQIK